MERNFISCCYFPTTVVLIDDDERFLESISFKLGRKLACKGFSDPQQAMQFLKNEYQTDLFTNRCLLRPEEKYRDHRNIEVDVNAIQHEAFRPERFNEISVLVVDYAMPVLNGLEFCEQFKGSRFKIILLTGEADEKVAIALFNKGVIHKFIRKDTPDFLEILAVAIDDMQHEYFSELSEIVINSLTKNPEYPLSCLDDPVFTNFFSKLCQQQKLTEYYLLDAYGSFVFLDEKANPSWLIIKDEDAMAGAAMDAELSDTEVPTAILEPLKKREKLLFLFNDKDFRKNPSEWLPYLHPAKILEGREKYYYALIENSKLYNIHPEKILSYKAYLDKL